MTEPAGPVHAGGPAGLTSPRTSSQLDIADRLDKPAVLAEAAELGVVIAGVALRGETFADACWVRPMSPIGLLGRPDDESLGSDSLIDFADDGEGHWFRNARIVVQKRTAFQAIEIIDVAVYGRILFLDGALQSSESDEHMYHEALIHPGLCMVAAPKNVLIIGGGEGASAREVLRHPGIERVTMVDIDREVVGLCREHLPSWHLGAFDDPRLRLVIQDGRSFVGVGDERFDVVVIDVVDSFSGGPAEALYTAEFYRAVRDRLATGGVVVIQGMECGPTEMRDHRRIRQALACVFATVRSYATFVPSFWCEWGFLVASDAADPLDWSAERIDGELTRRGLADRLRFYDGRSHRRMFELTKPLRTALDLP